MEHKGIFFSALGPDARKALLATGTRRHFGKGAMIFARGEPGDAVFFVETGRVDISVTSEDGRASVLNFMEGGDVIGEIAMLDRGARSADAVASGEVTGVMVSRQAVMSFLREDDDAMLAMIAELCAKVRNASEMFEAQRTVSGQARLATCLLRLADRWGRVNGDGSVRLGSNFTQRELGDFAGLSRENVNRHFNAWLADGVISQDDQKVLTIHDRAALEGAIST